MEARQCELNDQLHSNAEGVALTHLSDSSCALVALEFAIEDAQ
jgi:hypothetical protein